MKFFRSRKMMYSDKLLEAILQELKDMHFHLDRFDVFYKMVHNIKEDGRTGAWVEEKGSVKDKQNKTSD